MKKTEDFPPVTCLDKTLLELELVEEAYNQADASDDEDEDGDDLGANQDTSHDIPAAENMVAKIPPLNHCEPTSSTSNQTL